MRPITRWWRKADHFDWLTSYLRTRGLIGATQLLMAMISVPVVMVPIDWGWGTGRDDHSVLGFVVSASAGLVGLAFGAMWLLRWPTRRQSVAITSIGCLLMSVVCLTHADPVAGSILPAALTVSGGYFALFHTAKLMVANFCAAIAVGAVGAVRLAEYGPTTLAVGASLSSSS